MDKKRYTPQQRNTIFVAVVTAFITTFMGSALNLSIPNIEKDFGVSAAAVGWTVTVYMLSCAALTVPLGRIADIYDRKKILWLGIMLFAVSSAGAFFSFNMAMLIVLRGAQGVGASMIFSTNLAILAGAFDEDTRGRVLGYATASTYAGLSAGPVLGGFLNHILGWKSIFAAAAIISAAAFYCAFKKLPADKKEGRAKELDKKGSLLYIGAVVLSIYGLSELAAGVKGIAVMLCGFALFWCFIKAENGTESPVIKTELFTENRAYAFSNVAALINYGATFAVSYLISLYLQVAMDFGSQKAGLVLIVSPALMALLSPLSGRLSDRVSPHLLAGTGMGICGGAAAVFAFISESSPLWIIICGLVLSGTGMALFSSPNTNGVLASVEKSDYGVATSVLATMRSIGHAMSMAVITSVARIKLGEGSMRDVEIHLLISVLHICFLIFTVLCIAGIFMALVRKP